MFEKASHAASRYDNVKPWSSSPALRKALQRIKNYVSETIQFYEICLKILYLVVPDLTDKALQVIAKNALVEHSQALLQLAKKNNPYSR